MNSVILKGMFVLLCLLTDGACVFGQSPVAVEVFVDGKRYESLEQYKEARRESLNHSAPVMFRKDRTLKRSSWERLLKNDLGRRFRYSIVTGRRYFLSSADVQRYLEPQEDAARSAQEAVSFNEPFLEFHSRISRLGFNTGVALVIEDFLGQTVEVGYYKRLLVKDLETTLSRSFENSDYSGPILIISHNKKLRIMTLEDREAQSQALSP